MKTKKIKHAWTESTVLDKAVNPNAEVLPLVKAATFLVTAGLMIAACCLI